MTRPLKYINKLQGCRVLVLGGTSGIGFAVAEAAVEHAAEVIVSSSTQAKVTLALERLRDVSRSPLLTSGDELAPVMGVTCDVGDIATLETKLRALLDFATADKTKPLDHVVFTVGENVPAATFVQSTAEDLQARQVTRLMAPSILGKLLPGYIRAANTSSYTLTTAAITVRPLPQMTAYAGMNAAVEGTARGLAVELKPVRVNSVAFGLVPTEFHEGWPKELMDTFRGVYAQGSLTGSVGEVEDAAEPFLFCMKNAFVTGINIVSDGGKALV